MLTACEGPAYARARVARHGVVIGGSIAGLLAARALANHLDRVTLLERDADTVLFQMRATERVTRRWAE